MNYMQRIEINEKNEVVRASTDAFLEASPNTILIGETVDRQWTIPNLQDFETGVYLWEYVNGELQRKDEEVILGEKEPILQKRRIENRLAYLDTVIPRALEDLYELTGKQPFAPKNVEVIAEKKQLRLELKQYLP